MNPGKLSTINSRQIFSFFFLSLIAFLGIQVGDQTSMVSTGWDGSRPPPLPFDDYPARDPYEGYQGSRSASAPATENPSPMSMTSQMYFSSSPQPFEFESTPLRISSPSSAAFPSSSSLHQTPGQPPRRTSSGNLTTRGRQRQYSR